MPLTLDQLRTALPQILIREEGGELIASPSSTEEVSALLTHANTHNIPIEITGARTKRTWSGTAEAALILDTTRLNGVHAHPWQDLTATVGPGTPWAEMQRTLAAHNQFVALDPLWPATATVGGVLATNDSGALRLRYGSARDLVIGMTLVLADGTIAKTGGKVVKNVAGYDLHKLMIGAFGTLAVITEVTFRLHPLPQHRAAWSISSNTIEPIASLSAAITTSHLNPEAVQIRTTRQGFALDVLLAAAPEVLRTKGEALCTLASSHTLTASAHNNESHSVRPNPQEDDPILSPLSLFRARESLFTRDTAQVLKATMLPTSVPQMLAQMFGEGISAVAYPLGIVYAGYHRLYAMEPFEGSFTVLGQPPEPTTLMREIKHQFDPSRILNRGLMGGL